MSARGIIGGLAGMAASAVKHPKSTTEQALLGAKEMATTGVIVADKLIKKGLGRTDKASAPRPAPARTAPEQVRETAAKATETAAQGVERAATKVEQTAEKVAGKADAVETEAAQAAKPKPKAPAKKPAAKKPAAKKPAAKKTAAKKAPAKKTEPKKDDHDVVLAVDFPAPPEEPPVDVVGEALAKEAEEAERSGGQGSVLPPVRDEDEVGADPATRKAVRAEAEMMTKAASPRKS